MAAVLAASRLKQTCMPQPDCCLLEVCSWCAWPHLHVLTGASRALLCPSPPTATPPLLHLTSYFPLSSCPALQLLVPHRRVPGSQRARCHSHAPLAHAPLPAARHRPRACAGALDWLQAAGWVDGTRGHAGAAAGRLLVQLEQAWQCASAPAQGRPRRMICTPPHYCSPAPPPMCVSLLRRQPTWPTPATRGSGLSRAGAAAWQTERGAARLSWCHWLYALGMLRSLPTRCKHLCTVITTNQEAFTEVSVE